MLKDKLYQVIIGCQILLLFGCSVDPGIPGNLQQPDSEWLVPKNQVFDGGPGKDGIPSIDNPKFTVATEVDYLHDFDLVLGIRVGNQIKAYPHPILDRHEIVNDDIGGLKAALTYCPLTGTGIGWNRTIRGSETTFGVSGLLYNTNLMPYDRKTNSTWSQQSLLCVNGELAGMEPEKISLIETDFGTWLKAYPSSLVLNTNTGFGRDYTRYPYGGYRNNSQLLFPISNGDDRLSRKERVLGVFKGIDPVAFTFNANTDRMEVSDHEVNGHQIVVAASATDNILVAFDNGEQKQYFAVPNALPIIMKDEFENQYDLLGRVVNGPDVGSQLILPTQFIGYWFSWGTFYPGLELIQLK